ncbi:MAG: hypothetical protein KDH96_06960 [Candidatus Riesia sp.]|nr:hypothetical protein [Candidatus Riesia sp.]
MYLITNYLESTTKSLLDPKCITYMRYTGILLEQINTILIPYVMSILIKFKSNVNFDIYELNFIDLNPDSNYRRDSVSLLSHAEEHCFNDDLISGFRENTRIMLIIYENINNNYVVIFSCMIICVTMIDKDNNDKSTFNVYLPMIFNDFIYPHYNVSFLKIYRHPPHLTNISSILHTLNIMTDVNNSLLDTFNGKNIKLMNSIIKKFDIVENTELCQILMEVINIDFSKTRFDVTSTTPCFLTKIVTRIDKYVDDKLLEKRSIFNTECTNKCYHDHLVMINGCNDFSMTFKINRICIFIKDNSKWVEFTSFMRIEFI